MQIDSAFAKTRGEFEELRPAGNWLWLDETMWSLNSNADPGSLNLGQLPSETKRERRRCERVERRTGQNDSALRNHL